MSFCSKCGSEVHGEYCGNCGARAATDAGGAVSTTQPASSAPQPPAPYATWLRRVAGSLLDSIIFGLPSIFFIVFGAYLASATNNVVCTQSLNMPLHCTSTSNRWVGLGIAFIAIGIAISLGYIVYAIFAIGGKRGATIGMIIVKLRCTRDTTFTKVGYGLAFGRLLMTWVFQIITLVGLLDSLWPIWDDKHQTLHDKVASTVVLYEG